jgi:hypothetical protein
VVAVTTYRVEVTREGENWLAEVPGLPGANTYARNLEALDTYVREVIVLNEDLPDEAMPGLDLEWDYRTGDSAQDASLARLRADRRELEAKRQAIEQATAEAVRRLAAGYSVRDVAALTGLSRARVQQLVDAATAKRPVRSRATKVVPAAARAPRTTVLRSAVSGKSAKASPTRLPAAAKAGRGAR